MNRVKWITLGAAGVVAVAGVVLVTPMIDALQPSAGSATFAVLARAESEQDRDARERYVGDKTINLNDSRVVGKDGRSGHTFMLTKYSDQVCLVVVKSTDSSVGACNSETDLPARGLWVKYGEDDVGYLAVAVPDEFNDATIRSEGVVLLHEPNLVLVEADQLGQPTQIRFESPHFRDFTLDTKN